MARFRRLRRWLSGLALSLLLSLVYAAWPGSWTFTVSPETTHVTEPLDGEGYVDYPTALNERLRAGVTPETNANVLIWQALGPHPEGGTMPPAYFRWLGIESPPEQGEYYLSSDKYFQIHIKDLPAEERPEGWFDEWLADEPDEFPDRKDRRQEWHDRIGRAQKWPWKAADQPDLADWLKQNEKPLAVMIEASRRPVYFNPLVSHKTTPQSARLIGSLLPAVQKCRDVGRALTCRAMRRMAEGDLDGAWQDLLACHRLARLIGSRGTLIEGLVGIALDSIAATAELALLSHGRPSAKQALAWLEDLRKLPPMQPFAEKLDLPERFVALDALQSIATSGPQGLDALDGGPGSPGRPRFWDRLFTASIDFDPAFRNLNRTFDRCAAAARLPDRAGRRAEYGAIIGQVEQVVRAGRQANALDRLAAGKSERGERIGNILIGLMMPALHKIQDSMDRAEQQSRNLQVAFALATYRADHGRYPARLHELAPKYLPAVPGDLFSGGALIYRPEGDGYLLYSVGVNGVDDDGRRTVDEPRWDDISIRMPVPEPEEKPKANPRLGRPIVID